jgi:transcriptional regulator with XRE-family HTH domain
MTALAAYPVSDPREAAEHLAGTHSAEWLDAFSEALQRQRAGGELRRILQVWGLSQSEAARRFGVSRQSVAKWLASGVPASRVATIADLSVATDLLEHYLKRERIPGVVRRTAAALDDRSLLDLLETGDHRTVLEGCRAMFDFSRAQG